MPLPRGTDWRLVLILLGAALLGLLAITPMILVWLPRLIGPAEEAKLREFPMPVPVIILLGVVQNTLIIAAAIVCGLALGKKAGFGAPELEALRAGGPAAIRPGLALRLSIAAAIGLATGLLLIAVDSLILLPRTGTDLALWMADIPLWKRLIAGIFYGGIVEELLVRLFLVSALAWAFGKVWRAPDGRPAPAAVWTAILLATLLFAAGHLPAASRLGDLTPWLIARVLILNGIAGVVYGWLFTRRGLESAMVAHAATHIPLQTLAATAATIAQNLA